MPMYIQELAHMIEDQNTSITIEVNKGTRSFETNAYMLRRVLHTCEKLSGDNIVLTVSDESFEQLKRYLNP